jgi:hypothetical protein
MPVAKPLADSSSRLIQRIATLASQEQYRDRTQVSLEAGGVAGGPAGFISGSGSVSAGYWNCMPCSG